MWISTQEFDQKLQYSIEQKINSRIENDKNVRNTLNMQKPRWPLSPGVIECLVDGRYETPGMTENEKPHDGQSYASDSALSTS